jgi:Leucine-rich repeat (LRR) protein
MESATSTPILVPKLASNQPSIRTSAPIQIQQEIPQDIRDKMKRPECKREAYQKMISTDPGKRSRSHSKTLTPSPRSKSSPQFSLKEPSPERKSPSNSPRRSSGEKTSPRKLSPGRASSQQASSNKLLPTGILLRTNSRENLLQDKEKLNKCTAIKDKHAPMINVTEDKVPERAEQVDFSHDNETIKWIETTSKRYRAKVHSGDHYSIIKNIFLDIEPLIVSGTVPDVLRLGNICSAEDAAITWIFANAFPHYTQNSSLLKIDDINDLLAVPGNFENYCIANMKQVRELKELTMPSKFLTSLPMQLKYMEGLTKVNLSNNYIFALPFEFVYLTNLKFLNLTKNQISYMPTELKCTRLQSLILSENDLTEIPEGYTKLKSLRIFNVDKNIIKNLPDFSQFQRLKELDLSENQLCSLPKNIEHLSKLTSLKATNNKLKDIPKALWMLPSLKCLKLDVQNPLDVVPVGLLEMLEVNKSK